MKSKHLTTTEKEDIAMLAAQGMTPNRIGNIVKRDPKTVKAALDKPEVAERVTDYQERIASKYEQLAERIVDAVSDEDLTKASLQQKVISAACATDKARLLLGQSTENVAVRVARAVRELADEDY